jgi:hypothetical protein
MRRGAAGSEAALTAAISVLRSSDNIVKTVFCLAARASPAPARAAIQCERCTDPDLDKELCVDF